HAPLHAEAPAPPAARGVRLWALPHPAPQAGADAARAGESRAAGVPGFLPESRGAAAGGDVTQLDGGAADPAEPAGGRIDVGAPPAERPAAGGSQRFTAEVLNELLDLDAEAVGIVASDRVAGGQPGRVRRVHPRVMARGNFVGNLLRL